MPLPSGSYICAKERISKYRERRSSGIPIRNGRRFSRFSFPVSLRKQSIRIMKQIGIQAGKKRTVVTPALQMYLTASTITKSITMTPPQRMSAFFILLVI